jgi:hypothetical protein
MTAIVILNTIFFISLRFQGYLISTKTSKSNPVYEKTLLINSIVVTILSNF